jgi:hypothetical protein
VDWSCFIADQITLETGLSAACANLGRLADGGPVPPASRNAYGQGITALLQAGPVRCPPGARGPAGIQLGELAAQHGRARLPPRREITRARRPAVPGPGR